MPHVTTASASLDYVDVGRGPTVLLLHGVPGSAATWTPVIDLLQDRHRCVAPQLLGFGGSSGRGVLAPDQAEALLELVDELSLGPVVLVTHDFGGPVALEMLRRRPDVAQALLLSATNAFPDTPIPFPLVTVTWPVVGPVARATLFSRLSLRGMLRFGTGRGGGPVDARSHLGGSTQQTTIRTIFSDALQHLAERYAGYPDVLAGLTIPVTVLWGDKDPFFAVEHGRRTAQAVPDASFAVLPGAGHFLPEERPREVADAVADLVRRTQPAT